MKIKCHPCKHCGSKLTAINGVLIDETGGDICPVASLSSRDDAGNIVANESHENNLEYQMGTTWLDENGDEYLEA